MQQEAYYSMYKSLPSVPTLREMKPANATPPSFLKAHFNIILLLLFHFHKYSGVRAIVYTSLKLVIIILALCDMFTAVQQVCILLETVWL